jgi:hypothetical protein
MSQFVSPEGQRPVELGHHGRRPLSTRPIALPAVGSAASCLAVVLQVLQVPAGQLH